MTGGCEPDDGPDRVVVLDLTQNSMRNDRIDRVGGLRPVSAREARYILEMRVGTRQTLIVSAMYSIRELRAGCRGRLD